ncbi:MAG: hypothetical protein ACTHJR_02915 [Sphingomonas sp.]|uniref:hypothetical protein n=1 Tax=Sphingomonas sp. TaxID=28214 RepID=UPI003F8142A2
MKVFFDGGWRPATGMETAVVVGGREHVRRDLGPGSSLEAEWRALLHAVEIASALGLDDPVFLGDSLAVIGQARAGVACRALRAGQVMAFAVPGRPLRLRHVKRSQNLAGIALARLHAR